MKTSPRSRAALKVATLWLILAGTVALYGCAAPALQMVSPAATTQATATSAAAATTVGTPTVSPVTDQELASLGCVCHVQSEEGAPPVSQVTSLSDTQIMQAVRHGPGAMPAWNTQDLSDQLLTRVVNGLKSVQQGTPSAAGTSTMTGTPSMMATMAP